MACSSRWKRYSPCALGADKSSHDICFATPCFASKSTCDFWSGHLSERHVLRKRGHWDVPGHASCQLTVLGACATGQESRQGWHRARVFASRFQLRVHAPGAEAPSADARTQKSRAGSQGAGTAKTSIPSFTSVRIKGASSMSFLTYVCSSLYAGCGLCCLVNLPRCSDSGTGVKVPVHCCVTPIARRRCNEQ